MLESISCIFNPQCKDALFLETGATIFQIHPVSLNIKPWKGRHQVYGVFKLPSGHQVRYPVMITVKGAGRYRKEASMIQEYEGQDGVRLLQVHLKTRVAILMILLGFYPYLKEPLNWTLTYTQG